MRKPLYHLDVFSRQNNLVVFAFSKTGSHFVSPTPSRDNTERITRQPQHKIYKKGITLIGSNILMQVSNPNAPNSITPLTANDFATQLPATEKTPVVVVRYFLDRPGYGLHNSAVARLWWNPPPMCRAADVRNFLVQHNILWKNMLAEVYLDRFQAYMLLEVCEEHKVHWDVSSSSQITLDVRLTDLAYSQHHATLPHQPALHPPHANATPVGLFGFCYVTFLDTAQLMGKLLEGEGYFQPSTFGPYMFFMGGLPLFVAGYFQVVRNNLYGGTAFIIFGCYWMANGVRTVVELATRDSREEDAVEDAAAGDCVRLLVLLAFSVVLVKATFVMNRLSTTLITLLCFKIAFGAFAGWSHAMEWSTMVMGWLVGTMAFYLFMVEFLNQVYPTKLFRTFKWDLHSPKEVFGAAGENETLTSKAARLRQAASVMGEKED